MNTDRSYYDSDYFQHHNDGTYPDPILDGIQEKVRQELDGWRKLQNVERKPIPSGRRVPAAQEAA